jgi:serine phosphatase RsbU (regulator of sigma subunit)
MKHAVPLLLLLFSFTIVFPQTAKHEIEYFSAREYGKGHESANWASVQDKNGIMYFGNAGGVVQFDGHSWDFISLDRQSIWVKSLAVNAENKIFVGAENEFGSLSPDYSGKLRYKSLSSELPDSLKDFSSISRIWVLQNQVVFQSEEAVFLVEGESIQAILPETSFHLSFSLEGDFFVRQRGIGIMKLIGHELQLVKGSETFKNLGVLAILPTANPSKYLTITREDGFWITDKKSFESIRIKSKDEPELINAQIYGCIRLADGNIALNTLAGGIIICNENMEILSFLNKTNGLKVNGALSLTQDYQENIWAGLENGIALWKYTSPFSLYSSESGISGNIRSISRYNSKLYVGTSDGLFVQQETFPVLSNAFIPVKGFSKEVKTLELHDDALLISTLTGIYELKGERSVCISESDHSAISFSKNLNLLFAADKNGLSLYNPHAAWKKVFTFPEITEEIIRIYEIPGKEKHIFWMGTARQGLIRLKFSSPSDYQVDKYDAFDGLIENSWVFPMSINGQVVFSQRTGLMQFVDEEILKLQLPDSLKNRPEFSRGYFDFYSIDSLKAYSLPFYELTETQERIYTNLDGELGYFDKTDSLKWITIPFTLADIGKINTFFYENDGICWIGGDNGLIRFDEKRVKNYTTEFKTLITSITCTGDSTLMGQDSELTNNTLPELPVLDYAYNSIKFSFSSPFYEGRDKLVYAFSLGGQDAHYSEWQSANQHEYSNLREGNYTFRVKSKNAYGYESSEAVFSFVISPPWYRTLWAMCLYFGGFIFLVFVGVRLNSRRLIEKNRKLEGIILERTQEIKQKNIVLEEQKQEILDSINYALRIQKAVLPDDEMTNAWLGEHFIIFKPKDIVSGDFYWAASYDKYVFFCVADCTGHGVPGAFMSMLCISFLNEVILKEKVTDTGEIFIRLRKMIIESLKQKGVSGEQKDGMDITLCLLNKETKELKYSGANNPLYIVRGNDKASIVSDKQLEVKNVVLYEIKADSMPIAIHVKMDAFKTHTIQLQEGDCLYLFSDGFADQFGGQAGKKFMYKNFKTMLCENSEQTMEVQKTLLEQTIENWISFSDNEGNKHIYEQVDDICLMGIRI